MKGRGMALTAVSAILFGMIPFVTSKLFELGLNAVSISFYRYAFMLPILTVLCVRKKVGFRIQRLEAWNIFLHISFFSTITMLLLNSSYRYISTGIATTLHFLYPLFVILICKLFYRDVIDKKTRRSLFIMLAGIACFLENVEVKGMIGILLALLSGITYAVYLVQMEKKGLGSMHPLQFSLHVSLDTCILLCCVHLVQKSIHPLTNLDVIVWLIVISMMSLIALICLQMGSSRLGSKMTSLFSLFEPITSVLLGVAVLHESLQITKLAGCILILLAVLYLALGNKNSEN